ncbi:hypothetical protein RUM44_010955 [Polyplax serrata]|uniref:EF-hand domain-containing protein n=1 Tax=Polyplax serrata TaxID=468196 RepID=A0ABR1ANP5_POLSC
MNNENQEDRLNILKGENCNVTTTTVTSNLNSRVAGKSRMVKGGCIAHPAESANCQLRERIQRAIRELPTVEELKHSHHHRGHVKTIPRKRSASHSLEPVKRPSRDTIPQLAKSLETFLQKVIPNHSLVQDLMGYVTMPNPRVNSTTDLHLCKSPTASQSYDSPCECPPEYYCADFCREDYSVSTYISWQHFPRSTSSRSRCDDSSGTVVKSLSETPIPEETPKETESSVSSKTQYPIGKTISQMNALHYLEIRHIFKLMNFMIGHLVCNEPSDPVQFLEDLLEQCLKFRDLYGEPPLLFTHAHVESLYKAFDPFERGYLTTQQYVEALNTLGITTGITQYNKEPPLTDDGYVEDTTFMFEAERCLLEDLKQMLRIPFQAEENRLKWQMKNEKLQQNLPKEMEIVDENSNNPLLNQKFCDCFGGKENTKLVCRCPRPTSLRIEPEQLFLSN